MISSFCRPSSRPPEFAAVSHNTPKQGKVSFLDPDQVSPRSCTDTNIFLGSSPSNSADQEANAMDNSGNKDVQEETPAEVAMLLTSVASIASKEIKADPPIMSALADAFPRFPILSSTLSDDGKPEDTMDCEGVQQQDAKEAVPTLMHFDHKVVDQKQSKTRAVSMDLNLPELFQEPLDPPPSPPHEEEAIPTLLQWRNLRGESTSPPHHHSIFSTPPPSPLVSSRKYAMPNSRRSGRQTRSPRGRPRSVSLAESASIEQIPVLDLTAPESSVNDKPKKLILRKKFSWKNYPELEEFLIANREEYLRHSTLNYTQMQKKYNNCLTERMIKLASEHGYVFDDSEFSFVTVRDRIRCYYKSYVQSMKKRGVVIGYAARKAGLVSEEQLEESAHTSGKIYVPRN